jgi:hypothetical protein
LQSFLSILEKVTPKVTHHRRAVNARQARHRPSDQLTQRMQNELAQADAMGRAHEAAAACFVATGNAA